MVEISPVHLFETLTAFQRTAAMIAAIELDVFSRLAKQSMDPDELAREIGASGRGLRILCDTLTVDGFLEKSGTAYTPTPSSRAFLDRASPMYMGGIARFLAGPESLAMFLDNPAQYVRNGGAAGLGGTEPDHPMWITFAESMAGLAAPIAGAMTRIVSAWPEQPAKILDIAAGHGLYGITLAQTFPNARVVGLDWEPVLGVARRNAAAAGVSDRYTTLAGSAFEIDWGRDYDIILLPNFLHHFDFDACVSVLAKARAALGPGGRVLVIEFVPEENRIAPAIAARFPFIMLAATPKGDAYTASQFQDMALKAGFSGSQVIPLEPSPQTLVILQ